MLIMDEAAVLLTALAIVGVFLALWATFYRLFNLFWARHVQVGDAHRQFFVVVADKATGANEHLEVSVGCPPNQRLTIIRSIAAWTRLQGLALISIRVNRPNGATVYKWYEED